jgi:shikimate dehydrogenase
MPRMGFRGASVTTPHKEAAFALAATHDDTARATGAVNLIVFEDGTMHGLNTDAGGFTASVEHAFGAGVMRSGPAVVLGAGGGARAVVLALARGGAPEICVVNRTRARAEALNAIAPIKIFERADDDALADARFLVNASSLGMLGMPTLNISLEALPMTAIVADIVYNPLQTPLLKAAKARGNPTLDGLGMLMQQAVPAFAAWFGTKPSVTPALRAELEQALRA